MGKRGLDRRARHVVRPVAASLVAGLSLYLLLPSLMGVFSSWRSLSGLRWYWAFAALIAESASFASLWRLDRIALKTNARLAVACAQLTGNAVGRVVPGGGATAAASTVEMLKRAGFDTGRATAALGASTALQLGTTLALPLVALPAILGGAPAPRGLVEAAYLGALVLLVLVVFGVVAFSTNRPLAALGRAAQWLLNATVRRQRPVQGLPEKLLGERDFIRSTVGERWAAALLAAAANTGFDYTALLLLLLAVGAQPRPSLVLLAYAAGELLALVPLTPGGLGFVEAGLVGTLTLAGVHPQDAVVATLAYRVLSFWLPIPAGGVAYVVFRRRYG